jgi:hypothetical protein
MIALCRILGATLVALNLLAGQGGVHKDSSELDDLKMANEAFLGSLAVQLSPKGRSMCRDNSAACVGPDRGEMGLALLAARSSRRSLVALARLVRFRLDGAYAEEYDSYVLDKGGAIRGILLALHPNDLRAQCSREFAELAQSYRSALEGVSEDMVCADRTSVQERVRRLLEAIPDSHDSGR